LVIRDRFGWVEAFVSTDWPSTVLIESPLTRLDQTKKPLSATPIQYFVHYLGVYHESRIKNDYTTNSEGNAGKEHTQQASKQETHFRFGQPN
jgi:hypothetical protein